VHGVNPNLPPHDPNRQQPQYSEPAEGWVIMPLLYVPFVCILLAGCCFSFSLDVSKNSWETGAFSFFPTNLF
jgi:hypothetical protein